MKPSSQVRPSVLKILHFWKTPESPLTLCSAYAQPAHFDPRTFGMTVGVPCRAFWRRVGETSGEVPGADGAPEGQARWVCLPTQIWDLSPEVANHTVTALVPWDMFSSHHSCYFWWSTIKLCVDFFFISGISLCVQTPGPTGEVRQQRVFNTWSNTWATNLTSTRWAGRQMLMDGCRWLLMLRYGNLLFFPSRTKIFIRHPRTLFATEDAFQICKHRLGEMFYL